MTTIVFGTLAVLLVPFPWWIPILAVLLAKDTVEIAIWIRQRRRPPASGTEALVGTRGRFAEGGRVRVAGTTYPARSVDASPGDRVVVESVDGMRLVVRRASG